MRPHFIHDFGAANSGCAKAAGTPDKSDFGFKPLRPDPARKNLLLLSTALCALAFFEAITRALRDAGYPSLDDDMGTAVERRGRRRLSSPPALTSPIRAAPYKMLDPRPMGWCGMPSHDLGLPASPGEESPSAWRTWFVEVQSAGH